MAAVQLFQVGDGYLQQIAIHRRLCSISLSGGSSRLRVHAAAYEEDKHDEEIARAGT
jgi:6-phosphogluconolactonase/glucosamine-6-phosphate isomerase/deaminase